MKKYKIFALTASQLWGFMQEQKIPTPWLLHKYKMDKKHNNKHNHPHQGKLSPPVAMQIFFLQPIQCKSNADKGLGKGMVKAIKLNCVTDRVIN